MRKKFIFTLAVICCINVSEYLSAQAVYYYSSVKYTYGPYYFSSGMNLLKDVIAYKRMKERELEFKEEMRGRTKEVRDYYESFSNYPEKIENGWHIVTLVAGPDFIDGRKVYVENNKIREVYWDDSVPEKLVTSGPIT